MWFCCLEGRVQIFLSTKSTSVGKTIFPTTSQERVLLLLDLLCSFQKSPALLRNHQAFTRFLSKNYVGPPTFGVSISPLTCLLSVAGGFYHAQQPTQRRKLKFSVHGAQEGTTEAWVFSSDCSTRNTFADRFFECPDSNACDPFAERNEKLRVMDFRERKWL